MNEQVRLDLLGGAEREFLMGAVHGIARLEGNHAPPPQTGKLGTQFGWSQPQTFEVIVRRRLRAFDSATHVPRVALVQQVIGAGMDITRAIEDRLGFGLAVGLPHVFDVQNRQHHAFGIAQRNFAAARLEGPGEVISDIQGDRDGPQNATGRTHVVAHTLVIRARHEATQRREATAHQQFKIAELPRSQVP